MNTLLRFVIEVLPATADPLDSPPAAPPGVGERFGEIVSFAKWIGIVVCGLAFVAAAVVWSMGSDRPGSGPERMFKPLVAVAMISGMAGIVGFFV